MAHTGFAWLAGAALAISCTPSRPTRPAEGEARAPVVSVAKPPPAPPPASQSAPVPPARKPATADRDARDAGPCTPLRGPGIVRRGSNKYVQANTRAECARCKGDWGRHGLAGVVGCLCRTPDAGKPCESPHDCVAECRVDMKQAHDPASCPRVDAEFHGHCSGLYTTFGCHAYVAEKATPAGPLRGIEVMCVD